MLMRWARIIQKKIEELRILLDEIGMDGDYVISGCLVREKESSDKK